MRLLSFPVKLSYGHAKLLTLLALLVVIYWADLESLAYAILASGEAYVALTSLGFLCIYAFLKRRVVNETININGAKVKTGMAFFISSIAIYLIGSYFDFKLVCHMVSLVLFTTSYLLIRMNDLTLRLFSPTLAIIIALSLFTTSGLFKSAASALMLTAFASSAILFSNLKPHFKISVAVLNALLFLYLIVVSFTGQVLLLLAFLEFLLVWIIVIKGPFPHPASNFEEGAKSDACFMCSSGNVMGDFCPFCGKNLGREVPRSKFEVLEVSLFFLFFVASVLISIPILIKGNEEGVSFSYLTFQGTTQKMLSSSSESWLLYERRWLSDYEWISPGGLALKEVLVPESFPEIKNYTLVLELVPLRPIIANSWRFAPWKVHVSQNVMLMDSIPAIYYEVSSGPAYLKVLVWTDKVNFFFGGILVTRVSGISILRNFTSAAVKQNVTYAFASDPDTIEFLKDAEQIATKIIRVMQIASSWSYILYLTNTFMSLIGRPLLIILMIITLVALAMFTASKDRASESYLLELISKERLDVLLAIKRLTSSGIPTTGEKLLRELEKDTSSTIDGAKLMRSLEDLEALRLAKRSIRLGATKTFLEWKLAF